ncbi:MAG TPA: NAD-dependent epimerase/dehydratase family protein [Dongiaceae bacterium]|nr:NAD-dependent epimerase/dehydratase family protein [Dongiaceae bacterium]
MTGTVAVTGATGFIGSHLVPRLADAGWRVRILTRRLPTHPRFADTPVEAVIGALDEPDSLARLVRGADAVVHCAGLVKARNRAEFFRVNADGVRGLATAAAAQSPRPRFILLSSLAAREPALSAYAASKRAGEAALAAHGVGLPWTVLRPPAIYGPGDRETLPFFRFVARGIAPLLGPRSARLSLLHVDDLTAAVAVLLAAEGSVGATYELDDGRPGGYSWRAMTDAAARHLGTRARPVQVPRALLQGAALTAGLIGLVAPRGHMLTAGKVRELRHPDWVCHDRTLVERTAWRPRLDLNDGFAATIGWYRRAGWL